MKVALTTLAFYFSNNTGTAALSANCCETLLCSRDCKKLYLCGRAITSCASLSRKFQDAVDDIGFINIKVTGIIRL